MNIIWFIHMPKTGGTSVLSYLRKTKFKNCSKFEKFHEPFSLSREEELESLGDVKKITTLRNPIDHTCSLYSHMINVDFSKVTDPTFRENCKQAQSLNFSQWIRKFDLSDYYLKFYDPDCKPQWEGGKNPSLDNCIKSLKSFHIMRTESLTNDFNKFLLSIGEKNSFDIHINNSKKVAISKDDQYMIREIRKRDFYLYDNVEGINES